jgi:quercetin dioxygenase-like cupin family protein
VQRHHLGSIARRLRTALSRLKGEKPPAGSGDVAVLPDAAVAERWAIASDDLNATLVSWAPGKGVDAHRNEERDVLIVTVAGDGQLTVDDRHIALRAPGAVLIPRGAARAITAGPEGLRYLSVHRRRSGLVQLRH